MAAFKISIGDLIPVFGKVFQIGEHYTIISDRFLSYIFIAILRIFSYMYLMHATIFLGNEIEKKHK